MGKKLTYCHFLLCLVCFTIAGNSNLLAQEYGNEWINYDQEYYRIYVTEDGMYRIPYQEIVNSGFPAGSIDPRWIQLFYQGEEQAIYIKGEGTNGIFDPTGYIEFYGKRNRGYKDTIMFDEPENCINPDHSLFPDTSVYFLTYNNSINNLRMSYETDDDFVAYSSYLSPWCIKHLRENYTSSYYPASSKALYSRSEGWLDNATITLEVSSSKTLNLSGMASGGGNVEIELAVAGTPASSMISYVPHHLKVNFLGQTRIDELYNGYDFVRKNFSFDPGEVTENITFTFSSNDTEAPQLNDNNKVSYIDIRYPHSYNFPGTDAYDFYLKPGGGAKDLVEITGFGTTGDIRLYDLDQGNRIVVTNDEGTLKALVPNNGNVRHMILCNDNGYKQVHDISPVTPNAKFTDYTTLNKDPNYLIITHPDLMEAAEAYKSYRISSGYNAEVFNINELYDQYAYGVKKHPYAIRNLVAYYTNINGIRPQHLFLIGKGLRINDIRNNSSLYASCLVPTYGYSGSDILITARLGDSQFEPFVPTGRLAARNEDHVYNYLNKIMEYESNAMALWMKNILHFGGGGDTSEQENFANYLEGYEEIIEDTLFGGFVHTFLKNSSDPIQISTSDSVRDLINNGVTMMTFFGHGSSIGFDQSIDDPENYNNTEKYPFIFANSCFSGDIHITTNKSYSERWVLIPEKGAIAFLASVGRGIAVYLNQFADKFYKHITYLNYGQPLGVQQQEAIRLAQQGNLSDQSLEATCQEMVLHGDPAIRLNYTELPDLVMEPSGISFDQPEITTAQDSFRLTISMTNHGQAFADTFIVRTTREYPDQSIDEYQHAVGGCLYYQAFQIKMPVDHSKGAGVNKISVYLDFYDQIEELSETNNHASLQFLIKTGEVYPVYPYEYAIYPNSTVTLKASTGTPFIGETEFLFEMDTTDLFNSNMGTAMFSGQVTGPGGVISWTPPATLFDTTVYYWRVAANHPVPDSISWRESSFIYIPGKTGWSQAHPFQFKKDDYAFIDLNREERRFDYIETPKTLKCYNIGSPGSSDFNYIRFTIDDAMNNGDGDSGSCHPASAMLIAVIDPVTLKAWPANIADFGHSNYPICYPMDRPLDFFVFPSENSDSRQDMINMINNEVPDGYYILAYSFRNGNFENWTETEYTTFESLGADNIRSLDNWIPYIFFCKKGDTNTAEEEIGTTVNDHIQLTEYLYTDFNYGMITSTPAGPAKQWESLHWYQEPMEANNDSSTLEILFYDPVTNTTEPFDTLYPPTYDMYNLNTYIDYEEHPLLKLKFWTRDDSTLTPGQMKKWQLMFEGVPETAINPSDGFYISGDSITQGETLEFALATRNISPYDMDSLLVKYWLQTNSNQITQIKEHRLAPHPSGHVAIDTVSFDTDAFTGLNSVWIEYNPTVEDGNYDQAEQYHFNNIAQYYFYAESDNANPVLDVTFDGIHILDGDIVSAEPEILIRLKDENPFLPLSDTSLFRVYLTNMQTGTEQRIYFRDSMGNEVLQFIPAELPDNKAKILYEPGFTKDGIYQLRVQATDASGNESGDYDYIISFEVITESSITNVLNYPNPFSTSTRFVFELTGSVVPDVFRIEIYTVTGRLVKVIDKSELGHIHIGRNITEYAWDGCDMYGDQLANGVYFYRIKTEISGESIEHRSNESDKFFKKNIGKMYLMR
ncbi:MAG: C25 family cysteine peptidase [Candidatus Delongbacteria bacterium]|nr:C25 family cysteine peptidase [Candidatus Delongbacteria bacterium]